MITTSQFSRLALDANERLTNVRDDVLPIPRLEERVTLYLRAVNGNRDFTEEERSNARNLLLNSMAAEIAAQVIPVEQSLRGELPGRETTNGAGGGSSLVQYSRPEKSVQRQQWALDPEVMEPPPPYEAAALYWQMRKEAIRAAPIARRRTIVALTATVGLILIVMGGTLGYRRTYPYWADEVTGFERQAGETQLEETVRLPAEQAGVPPLTTFAQVPTAPDKAAPKQHMVYIISQRGVADAGDVFRRLQKEQPTPFGQSHSQRHPPISSIDLSRKCRVARRQFSAAN